jgi:hypothetical protein
MKNSDIADLLREYARSKNKVKELRVELMRVAVVEIGLDQK